MAKVTSKYQVTVPKVIADQYGIRPGDNIEWVPAGEVIRVLPPNKISSLPEKEVKLKLFDASTGRLRARSRKIVRGPKSRGWTREDLYDRGRSY